jgi:alpha-D-ribose 1-methylphosphonate 5-triphosphate synthase subunit PhnG
MTFVSSPRPGRWSAAFILFAVAALVGIVAPASAQVTPSGQSTILRNSVVRGVDAAFDPSSNTYMVVGAQDEVFAVCTDAAGAATSPVYFLKPKNGSPSNKPFGSFPRVRYSQDLNNGAGAFMVIWQQEEVSPTIQIHSRIVSCGAGPLGTEHTVDGGIAPWADYGGSALAYSATSKQFLVAWKTIANPVLSIRLMDLNGEGVGSPVTVSSGFGRDPSVTWNPTLNEFGVAFSGETATGGYSVFVRVPATNIAGWQRTSFNIVPGQLTAVTDIDFNLETQRYMMTWYETGGYSRVAEFDASGNLLTTGLVWTTIGSYDALSLAYNPISKTFTLVGLAVASDHVIVSELNGRGFKTGLNVRVDTSPSPARYTRIVSSSTDKKWMTTFNAGNFVYTVDQMVVTGSSDGGSPGAYPAPGGGGACSYSLSPTTSGTISAAGGVGTVTMTAGSGCAWTATTADSWIHITAGASGNSSGSFSYSVDPNAGLSRSGTIVAGGQSFAVTQSGGCSYAVSPTGSVPFAAGGGIGSFALTATSGCTWTATTAATWIHVNTLSGGGSATIDYTVDANLGPARMDSISVGGQTYAVSQVAFDLPPGCSAITVLARPPAPPPLVAVDAMWQATGITLTAGQPVTVTATGTWSDAGVALTAAGNASTPVTGTNCPLSGQPLMALIGRIGTTGTPFLIGATKSWTPTTSGVLYLAPQDNWYTTSNNTGSLTVIVCLGSSGGCTYELTPTASETVAAGGGGGSFAVTTGTSCAWTASTSDGWIHITAGSGSGSGTVTYTVDPNTDAARTGTITIGGQIYTVSQAVNGAPTQYLNATVLARPTPPADVSGVDRLWQASSFTLTAGQPVTLTATGTWSAAGVALTAAGSAATMVTGTNCPLSGAPLLALIGRIGATGTPFLIGATKTFTPTATGVLYMAPQDDWYHTWDNAGSLAVTATENTSGGCTFALTPTASGTVAAGGGSGSFTVMTGTGCAWTAATGDGWIHITAGSGSSSGTVSYTVDANAGAARTGTITVGGQTYTVSQAQATPGTCSAVTVLAQPTPPAGVSGVDGMWQTTGITVTAGQPVTVTATGTWSDAGVALTAAGNGSSTVTGTNCPLSGQPLMALIGRIGTTGSPFLIGAAKSWTPATSGILYLAPQDNWYTTWNNTGSLSVSVCLAAGGACSYGLDPAISGTLNQTGGSGSFAVTTDGSCSWTPTTTSSWIHITSGAGPGSATVAYTVDVNLSSARTGTIVVGDQSYTVSQAADPTSTCATVAVLAKPTPPPGVPGVDGMWQTTGITLTAGQPVTVTATGAWSDAGVSLAADGSATTTVTGTNCPLSGQPLMALIGRVGTTGTPFLIGASKSWTPTTSGVLYLAPQDNWYTTWDNAGTLSVDICAGATGGCTYALTPTASGTVAAGGGGGSLTVTTGTGCVWTATTGESWIHITAGSGPGSGTVSYAVDLNTGAARTGTITAGGQAYAVSQAAGVTSTCDTVTVLAQPPAQPGLVAVDAMWQSTGITLTAGQAVTATAAGTWSDAGVSLTAAGSATTTVTGTNCPLSGQPLMALIGRIGPTGAPFLIGATRTFTPAATGVLYLAPQDNWYLAWDNAGSLSVTICR